MTMKHLFVILVMLLALVPVSNAASYADEINRSKAVEKFRNAAATAVAERRFGALAQIEKEVAAFKDSSGYDKPVFHDVEVIMMKFLERDYAFVANPDSVAAYIANSAFMGRLYSELLACIKRAESLGEIERELERIENTSDRAFVRVIMARLANVDKKKLVDMIDEHASEITNEDQLRFLVQRFWSKEGYDYENYWSFSAGAAYNMPFGGLSDTLGNGFGFMLDGTYVTHFIAVGFLAFGHFHDIQERKSAELSSGGFAVFVGGEPRLTPKLFLKPYAGFGVQVGSVKYEESPEKDATQGSMMVDIGVAFDIQILEAGSNAYAIRFRSGLRSLMFDELLNESGFAFYTGIEIRSNKLEYKKFEFDYSKARK